MTRKNRHRKISAQQQEGAGEGGQAGRGGRAVWFALLLVLGTALTFGAARKFDFIDLDDDLYITRNPVVQQGVTRESLWWGVKSVAQANCWHPLTWWSHMLDCQIFGLRAGGHHLTNVVLHVVNTVLLFLVVVGWSVGVSGRVSACGDLMPLRGPRKRGPYKTTSVAYSNADTPTHRYPDASSVFPAFLIAALFGVHPLHVEPVAWISQRKELLCGFFWILTLGAYTRYAREAVVGGRWSVIGQPNGAGEIPNHQERATHNPCRWYGVALLCFAGALMSKPMAVTLPFVLLLLDVWPLGRWRVPPLSSGSGWSEAVRNRRTSNTQQGTSHAQVGTPKLDVERSLLAIGCSSERPRWLVLEKVPFLVLSVAASAGVFLAELGGGTVASLEGLSLQTRLGNAIVQYVQYLRQTFWPTGLSIYYVHPQDRLSLIDVWVCAGLLLAISGAVWLGRRRRPYLLVGWCWFLGVTFPVMGLVQSGTFARADRYMYLPLVGIFIMLAWGGADLAAAAARRYAPRRVRAVAVGVAVGVLVACSAVAQRQLGYWRNAYTILEHALAVDPDNFMAAGMLGQRLQRDGRYAEALPYFQRATALMPHFATNPQNLGSTYLALGRFAEAIGPLRAAIRLKPAYVEAHNNLALALASLGRADEARAAFMETLRIDPACVPASVGLAILLVQQGDYAGAAHHLRDAVARVPDNVQAREALAWVEAQGGASNAESPRTP